MFSRYHARFARRGQFLSSSGIQIFPFGRNSQSTKSLGILLRDTRIVSSSLATEISPRSNIQCNVPDSASLFLAEALPSCSTGRIPGTSGQHPRPCALQSLWARREISWETYPSGRIDGLHAPHHNDRPCNLSGQAQKSASPKIRFLDTHRRGKTRVAKNQQRPSPCLVQR